MSASALDMQREQEPVIFAVQGRGKYTLKAFSAFLGAHGGIRAMLLKSCAAFLNGTGEHLPDARATVDWFNIVWTFTKALDEVRKRERREKAHTKCPALGSVGKSE
ncbi:transposase [Cobetia sp. QF-1]|uniref:transposase n=1 Tax=Cobetia sp. QF-1 TaxID=1969833 RepID=UPI00112FDA33|nr:transposase [Cobetia sp. QF-1]